MTFTLTLSAQDVATIGQALNKMPYGEVAGLIANLQNQINEQSKPASAEETPSE